MEPKPKSEHGTLRRVIFFLKFLEIRLRFVFILIITALVVGYWDHLQNHIERWQRHWAGHADEATVAAQSEYEFFCPMHPFVIRDHEGKCPVCGMDLVKRKHGAPATLPEGTLARVQVSPERVMQAGIATETVGFRLLTRMVQSYGVIEPDETRLARIIARFPGRIDKLEVNAVGMQVARGQALAQIYSPKFLTAIQEYRQALQAEHKGDLPSTTGSSLSSIARQRLLLAGFTTEQIEELKGEGSAPASQVTLYSPQAGTVIEKSALVGEAVEEGTVLYTIADLSRLWVQVLVIESDVAAVKPEMPVEVTSVTYPGEIFFGTVDFIMPTVDVGNRSVRVRVVVDNPAGKLKPGMYVSAVLRSPIGKFEVEGAAGASSATLALTTSTVQTVTDVPAAKPELPTQTQEAAAQLLATLAPGAEYFICSMDPEVVSDHAGDCPKCGMHLIARKKTVSTPEQPTKLISPAAPVIAAASEPSSERWAEGYSCAMHPDELSPKPGVCVICGCGMKLRKYRIERVLSVPELAVIDTGTKQVVYVETAPGIYDARAVTLGPRAGAFYPVMAGLSAGEQIATRGSFLIDAEARLNPAS